CHHHRPSTASCSACFFDSARCQDISTRQLRRSTVWPCFLAASSAKLHWIGSACRPSSEVEAIDSTPMPYLPASCMPEGLIEDAAAIGISSCSGSSCSCV